MPMCGSSGSSTGSLPSVVDFITIHILPYWEDFPVRAGQAGTHVDQIWQRMTREFPGKEILLGESGWPSAGRMREGALPSRVNQARVVSDVVALAQRDKFRLNLIEAYDQPWKRGLEGTVGGYWGILDAYRREVKFAPGAVITDYPFWRWQAGAGVFYAALMFTVAFARLRRRPWSPRWFVLARDHTMGDIGWNFARHRGGEARGREHACRRLCAVGPAAACRLLGAVHGGRRADGASRLAGLCRTARSEGDAAALARDRRPRPLPAA